MLTLFSSLGARGMVTCSVGELRAGSKSLINTGVPTGDRTPLRASAINRRALSRNSCCLSSSL